MAWFCVSSSTGCTPRNRPQGKISRPPLEPSRCWSRLSQFLQAAKHCGINTIDIFQTADIWEEKNIAYMQWMLMNLGGLVVAQDNGLFSGDPNCFPKKSKENLGTSQTTSCKRARLSLGCRWAATAGHPRPGCPARSSDPIPALFLPFYEW